MIQLKIENQSVVTGAENLPIFGDYDVVVVGGGMAGTGAAIAAGRAGAKTILVENGSALGGLATLGLVNIPLDFLSGLGQEFFDRLTAMNGLRARNSNVEKHKLLFDRMVKEAGVEVLFVTPLVDTIVEGDTVRGIVIQTKEGRKAILGKRFVDASGDSELVYYAGGEVEIGRDEDHISMGCSLEFILGGVNIEEYRASELARTDRQWKNFLEKAIEDGEIPPIDNHLNWMTHVPGRPEHCGMDEVSICFAHSRYCRPCDNRDLTRMYFEGREQCEILADFIKKRIPGFQNSYLAQTGSLLGVRESRRIVGEYRFTGEDIAYARSFDDVIAISHHGFDMHGFEGPGNIKWFKTTLENGEQAYVSNIAGWGSKMPPDDGLRRINMSELIDTEQQYRYDIPYRSLVPIRLENVLAAGRNLSSNVPGQSGARLLMLCMAMGEAAGNACVMSLQDGVTPRKIDVGKLQRRLVANGCNLGQGFRRIPSLADADYSSFNVQVKPGSG